PAQPPCSRDRVRELAGIHRNPSAQLRSRRSVDHTFSQLLDRPLYRRRTILHLADEPDLAAAAALRERHRVLLLGYIKCDERFAILCHGSPSVREDRLGPSEQPSSFNRMKGRATDLRPRT